MPRKFNAIENGRIDCRKWRAKNKEKKSASSSAYYLRNSERIRARKKEYRQLNAVKICAQRKLSKQRCKPNIKAYRIRCYLGLKQASPLWADLDAIKDVYLEAEYMQMHVDHIIPLRSKLVCGLHVWDNLQLLTPKANLAKGNRHWPDMP